jgi:hypothetical protein
MEKTRSDTHGAVVQLVKLSLDPNGRVVTLRVEGQPQAVIKRSRISHIRAERGKERARCPPALVLFVILSRSRRTKEGSECDPFPEDDK